jgi:uncharacterized damage-inducible protein DinB
MTASKVAPPPDFAARLLDVWCRHDDILLYLLDQVPARGLAAVPAGSRGRTVAAQFAHLHRVRTAWVRYFETGARPDMDRYDKDHPPTKTQLKTMLGTSGRQVRGFLAEAFAGRARTRMFGGDPVRWLGYLIAHESHHRGQILLALKQNGMRLPAKVSLEGMWGRWFAGK